MLSLLAMPAQASVHLIPGAQQSSQKKPYLPKNGTNSAVQTPAPHEQIIPVTIPTKKSNNTVIYPK